MNKIITSILLSISLITPATAESTESSRLVDSTVLEVQKTVKEKSEKLSPEKLDEALRDLISPVFDFQEMSKRCLGANWKIATADEKVEFQKLFSNMLAKNYIKQIREKALGSKFVITSATEKDNKAVVYAVVTNDAGTLKIDYRLYKTNTSWKVYDVIIENIGLVSNYRSEFSDIVNKEGMPGLIKRLREKV